MAGVAVAEVPVEIAGSSTLSLQRSLEGDAPPGSGLAY